MAPRYAAAASSPQDELLNAARKQYPFISKHDVKLSITPNDKKPWGYAETWLPGDMGWQGTPEQGFVNRPQHFPPESIGIDVYQPNEFSVHDIAGEVLHADPMANKARDLLAGSLTPRQMQILRNQNDYKMTNDAEPIKMRNAIDSLMRGYLVGKWPAEAIKEFGLNTEQKRHLDTVKNYMMSGE